MQDILFTQQELENAVNNKRTKTFLDHEILGIISRTFYEHELIKNNACKKELDSIINETVTDKFITNLQTIKNITERYPDTSNYYEALVYTANKLISNTKQEINELRYSIQEMKIIKNDDLFKQGISCDGIKLEISLFFVKNDYATNVFLPVINNIYDHAFNTENDIYGRLKQKGYFYTSIYIDSTVKEKTIDITVKDYGFGIKPENIDKIFDGFSTKNDPGKHGIGLSHAKSFMKEHNGDITVASELGRGTTFTVSIPYSRKQGEIFYE